MTGGEVEGGVINSAGGFHATPRSRVPSSVNTKSAVVSALVLDASGLSNVLIASRRPSSRNETVLSLNICVFEIKMKMFLFLDAGRVIALPLFSQSSVRNISKPCSTLYDCWWEFFLRQTRRCITSSRSEVTNKRTNAVRQLFYSGVTEEQIQHLKYWSYF